MKLTPGKLAGLKNVSNDRGVIAAAAMDQRGSLKKMIAKARGDKAAARKAEAELSKTWIGDRKLLQISNL